VKTKQQLRSILFGAARLFDFGGSLRAQPRRSAINRRRRQRSDCELVMADWEAVLRDLEMAKRSETAPRSPGVGRSGPEEAPDE